jgi:hypothetical protein
MVFSLRQLSALGYWQAGAEMFGGDLRRAHADAHRALQIETATLLQASLRPRHAD